VMIGLCVRLLDGRIILYRGCLLKMGTTGRRDGARGSEQVCVCYIAVPVVTAKGEE
jgi:hypothetical protein